MKLLSRCSRFFLYTKKYQSLSQTSTRVASRCFTERRFNEDEVYDQWRPNRDGPILLPDGNVVDFLIIGGGIVGQALAYNLWRILEKMSLIKAKKEWAPVICVCEKDPSMLSCSTNLSAGGIRTQFSNPSNIALSMATAEFLNSLQMHLSTVENPDPDIQFQRQGYLMLATAEGAPQLMKNHQVQTEAGAKVMLLTKEHLKETFPWVNTDGIELATYGLENEGWFDPAMYLSCFKKKNPTLGIKTLNAEVVGFKKELCKDMHPDQRIIVEGPNKETLYPDGKIEGVYVKHKDHDKPVHIKASKIINCAGPMSGYVAGLCGIGNDDPNAHPIAQVKLPVERRKRYVYVVHCPDAPMFDFPFLVDPSGVYVRREGFGGKYICGSSPTEDQEPDNSNLDVDYDFFDEHIWPKLAHRIPAFENLKVTSAWAGYYDYNTFDQNAIIGQHPLYPTMWFITGFSGHGIQQAYGASYMLAEKILKDLPNPILDTFAFTRVINNTPLKEINII